MSIERTDSIAELLRAIQAELAEFRLEVAESRREFKARSDSFPDRLRERIKREMNRRQPSMRANPTT